MKTIKATSAMNKLINFLISAKKHFKYEEIWWRGQRSEDWKLDAGLWRRNDAEIAERDMMSQFCRKALSRHAKCPVLGDSVGWLFLMQHYRLQTRLLDWTESFLIATYFAVKKSAKEEEVGALYALSPYILNANQFNKTCIFSPNGPTIKPLFDSAFTVKAQKVEKIAAIHSNEIDVRLMAQQSVFTIHGFKTPLDEIDGNEHFLMKFEIDADLKKDLHWLLYEFGVRESTVFPDLEHLANEFREHELFPV